LIFQEYLFWVDEYNYGALTSKAYSNSLSFPHYLFFLHSRRNEAMRRYEASNKQPKDLIKDAINVLNALSAKLGESKYFYGNKPSSLDALIFGYLAPLLKLPLANDRLQLHLSSQPNVCIFLENLASIYMPLNEKQLCESLDNRADIISSVDKARKAMEKQRDTERSKKAEREKANSDSGQNLFLFGLVSITLSVAFAIHTGIIKFVVSA
jgi:metaxin